MIEKPRNKKASIYKPKPISGFPEWLPEERLAEQRWFDHIRKTFESYGFCSIETPSVEEIDVLLAKGEVDKEIYVLERLHKDEDSDKESRLALHFDQTVPFARYTAQHFNDLVFPFKRYQMQRVWRGERPQMGRMREFYQCDIDVINVDNLPLSFDSEIASMIYETLEGLNIGRVQLRISNRRILLGFIDGIEKKKHGTLILRILDKLEKIGEDAVLEELNAFPLDSYEKSTLLKIAQIKVSNSNALEASISKAIFPLEDIPHEDMIDGIHELKSVLDNLSHLPEGAVVADLSIVRGLDYYTGTVYETQLLDIPEYEGSVCSGGRYDDLAGQYINKHLPGVGISIGFSRLFDVIRQTHPEKLGIGPKSPTDILVYTENKNEAALAIKTAQTLRQQGLNVEVYHTVKKWDKHYKYAKNKMIPTICYPQDDVNAKFKNVESGEENIQALSDWNKS
ncbi:MAG: histidine--tRNA ligase [Micavibrio sp.]|nr:histidine--tRNA ligase [Micavibrio sp.]